MGFGSGGKTRGMCYNHRVQSFDEKNVSGEGAGLIKRRVRFFGG
jgi:hypothetical protein